MKADRHEVGRATRRGAQTRSWGGQHREVTSPCTPVDACRFKRSSQTRIGWALQLVCGLLTLSAWALMAVAVAAAQPSSPPAPPQPPAPSVEPVPEPEVRAGSGTEAPPVPPPTVAPVPPAAAGDGAAAPEDDAALLSAPAPAAEDPAAAETPAVQGPLRVTNAPASAVTDTPGGTYRPNPLPPGAVVAVLPVRGGQEDSGGATSAQLAAIRAQAERELVGGLKAMGYRVLLPQQARAQIKDPRMVESCLSALGRCNYRALLAPLGAGAVVAGALWIRDRRPVEVFVRVTRAYSEGAATRDVDDDLEFLPAFQDAAKAALARAEHPLAISVRVETEPKGALLTVDREREATAPTNLALSPGKHLLVVSHPGFVTRSLFVDVPEAAIGAVVQKVTLIADTASAGPMALSDLVIDGQAQTPGSSSLPWDAYITDYIVGGVLALGSVALLTAAVATAVADGRCVEQDPHAQRCVIEEDGNGTPLFVGAVVTGVTAAALFTLTPLTDLRETAGLQLTTSF